MKRSLIILLCLLPGVAMAQTLEQKINKHVIQEIHKQITEKARLHKPFFFVGGYDQIKAQRADSIALRLKIKQSGSVKLLDIPHASYPAINEVVCDAVSRVRLPKGLSGDGEVVVEMTFGFRDTLVQRVGGYVETKQAKVPGTTTHYKRNNSGYYTMQPMKNGVAGALEYTQAQAQGQVTTAKPSGGSHYSTLTFVVINTWRN